MAIKSPLSDTCSSMNNLLVAGPGTSDLHPKLDYCDKLQKQTWSVLLITKLYNNITTRKLSRK